METQIYSAPKKKEPSAKSEELVNVISHCAGGMSLYINSFYVPKLLNVPWLAASEISFYVPKLFGQIFFEFFIRAINNCTFSNDWSCIINWIFLGQNNKTKKDWRHVWIMNLVTKILNATFLGQITWYFIPGWKRKFKSNWWQ
jgi:hypothetical protein